MITNIIMTMKSHILIVLTFRVVLCRLTWFCWHSWRRHMEALPPEVIAFCWFVLVFIIV
jgi:hypothetical protein